MNMKKTVVIADDHHLIAEALGSIIERFQNFEVLYQVGNGKELIEKFGLAKNIPDIVLLDINMPVMDGFKTAQWLKQQHPGILILALSMQDQEDTIIKMIRCGASGYLLKNTHPSELDIALQAMVTKGYYYPDWVTHKMILNMSGEKEPLAKPTVTERELEFLTLAASDLTYKEIGDKMCCSNRTVESYRDSLFEKFGVKTRVALILYALKHQVIQLPE
jgi:DNA-binding NarL/FixJ family response regulator